MNFHKHTMEKHLLRLRYVKRILFWVKEWSRLIATSLVFLLFCTMLIVVIEVNYHQYLTETQNSTSTTELVTRPSTTDSETTLVTDLDNFRNEFTNCTFESKSQCSIRCSYINDVDIPSSLDKLDFSGCIVPEITLHLTEVYFTNNTVTNGWLSDLSRDVAELNIYSPLLTELGDSAFSGKPFDNLQTLVISDSRIRLLRKESFKGLRIQTFEFRCPSAGNIYVEFNALEYIADYLNTLQFNQCIDDSEVISNITGTKTSIFNKLTEMDLSYNTFRSVLNNSFVDAPRLISLYLFSNNIISVDINAFHGISDSVQLLSLKNNKLETLPDGVFESFTRKGEIDIQGNPWNCNCDLVWLKNFYIRNIDFYFKSGAIPFECTEGDYSEVDFCPGKETSDIPTTTSTTSTSTTIKPDGFVYLDCYDITENQDVSQDGLNRIYSHTVKVRNGTITYNFYQIEGTPNFEIKLLNNVGNDYLIWINSRNSSDYGCVTNIQETVVLNNLHYGMTYTICLLKESADTVTPFDCTSLTVPLQWEYCAWIINKHMPAVIGGLVGIALAVIIITSIIMFYTIRQNPKLIKGNKKVIIVRNKSGDTLVMPNYNKQPYAPASVYTNSEGYLTPRNKMYEKINERRFRPLNTITEKFYQDFHAATPRHSRASYTGFLHRQSVGSEVYEPPPLPPNHPSERPCSSRDSTIYKH